MSPRAMHARLDTPAALITTASNILGRIMRVAAHVPPMQCLRLQGELALTGQALDDIEKLTALDAQYTTLAAMKPKKALPPPCPEFVGGRRALPPPRQKRLTAREPHL
jgi:hypothetical protein